MTSFAEFQARQGETFQAATSSGAVALRMTGCRSLGPNSDPNSFSLTFMGDRETPIEQDTYPLSAPGFGPEPIFLVPVASTPDGVEYEAVFHRLPG